MRHVIGKAVGLAIAIAVPALGADESFEQPYEWSCKALGYFGVKVSPDGRYSPNIDANATGPIHITIQRRSEEGMELYKRRMRTNTAIGALDVRYTVSLSGPAGQLFASDGPIDFYDSGVRFNFPTGPDPTARRQGLKGVEAIYWQTGHHPQILSIQPADRDWVFSVYSGGLTTDVEARHLNIEVPGLHWDAGAEAYLLTGPCVRKR
jgi:hypothetical protein